MRGAPNSHRHVTSSIVSEGRVNTQPICPTTVWVPRNGPVLMLLDDKVHRLAWHDDDLDNRLACDPALYSLIRQGGSLNNACRRTRRNANNRHQLAVNLHRNLKFIFCSQS